MNDVEEKGADRHRKRNGFGLDQHAEPFSLSVNGPFSVLGCSHWPIRVGSSKFASGVDHGGRRRDFDPFAFVSRVETLEKFVLYQVLIGEFFRS